MNTQTVETESTREQDAATERLCCHYGRVHVRTGYTDKCIRVTCLNGPCHTINPDGITVKTEPSWSVRWAESEAA